MYSFKSPYKIITFFNKKNQTSLWTYLISQNGEEANIHRPLRKRLWSRTHTQTWPLSPGVGNKKCISGYAKILRIDHLWFSSEENRWDVTKNQLSKTEDCGIGKECRTVKSCKAHWYIYMNDLHKEADNWYAVLQVYILFLKSFSGLFLLLKYVTYIKFIKHNKKMNIHKHPSDRPHPHLD